jgi:hypothetical protein
MMAEYLHIRPIDHGSLDPTELCQVHGWPTDGLGLRLIEKMRQTHGKGGVNVCRACLDRAREALRVVHILHEGRALCGQSGLPTDWPSGHRWVRREDDGATCRKCVAVASQMETPH